MPTAKKATRKRTVRKSPVKKRTTARKKAPAKKRSISRSLKPFTIEKEPAKMATRKRRKRKPVSTTRKRRSVALSGTRRSSKKDIVSNLITGATAVAGAIGGSYAVNKLPIDDKLKAVIPFAGGALIASKFGKKHKAVEGAALGLMVMGGLSLVKQFAPNLPLMAGEESYFLPYNQPALGLPYEQPDDADLLTVDGSEFVSPSDL